jgi:hypothetical protein
MNESTEPLPSKEEIAEALEASVGMVAYMVLHETIEKALNGVIEAGKMANELGALDNARSAVVIALAKKSRQSVAQIERAVKAYYEMIEKNTKPPEKKEA